MHAPLGAALALWIALSFSSPAACTNGLTQVGLGRILHGWTNYSTGFNATHDSAPEGDYATVASFFTPAGNVVPQEYAVIVVWLGDRGQTADFTRFTFSVNLWSELAAFTNNPRTGDVARLLFQEPTAGSTTTPDAYTRGGRPAYELRFCLTNAPMLAHGQTYLVGFAAHTASASYGELFVPTSSHRGRSDVQGGTLITGGWRYLVDAGGSTTYDGQLAVELLVAPPPSLTIDRTSDRLVLSWPVDASTFVLEFADQLSAETRWLPVLEQSLDENGSRTVRVPAEGTARYFRLRR